MKIIRKVNGQTMHFELSDDELRRAYFEQQEKFDVQSVINYIESYYEDDEDACESVNDYELMVEAANEVRECINDWVPVLNTPLNSLFRLRWKIT